MEARLSRLTLFKATAGGEARQEVRLMMVLWSHGRPSESATTVGSLESRCPEQMDLATKQLEHGVDFVGRSLSDLYRIFQDIVLDLYGAFRAEGFGIVVLVRDVVGIYGNSRQQTFISVLNKHVASLGLLEDPYRGLDGFIGCCGGLTPGLLAATLDARRRLVECQPPTIVARFPRCYGTLWVVGCGGGAVVTRVPNLGAHSIGDGLTLGPGFMA
ncbi:hypothetical protein ACLB2K_004178 [Fragaria x ananassa]